MKRVLMGLLATMTAVACGGTPPAESPRPIIDPLPKEATEAPKGSIDRRDLEEIMGEGPSWILRRVPIEEVMSGGRFIGWRVQRFPAQWEHVDLRPGDIVHKVNGQRIETPDRFWSAWTTLTVASELTISFERDGKQRQLRVPIWGKPDPKASERIKNPGRRKPVSSKPTRRKTVIIRPPKQPESGNRPNW